MNFAHGMRLPRSGAGSMPRSCKIRLIVLRPRMVLIPAGKLTMGCDCKKENDCGHVFAKPKWQKQFGKLPWYKPDPSFTCSSEGGKQGCWCRPEEPFAVCYPRSPS